MRPCCNSKRRSAWLFVLGFLFLSTVGVRCLAIGEINQDHRRRVHPTCGIPRAIHGVALPNLSSRIQSWRRYTTNDDKDDKDIQDIEEKSTLSSKSQQNLGNATSEDSVNAIPRAGADRPSYDNNNNNRTQIGNWPCFDELDKELIRISLPVIGNYAINPMIGAVDLFWVNRMGNALAVAGQAAANQVFSSAFWFTSFLPSGEQTRYCVICETQVEDDNVNHVFLAIFFFFVIPCSHCNVGFETTCQWKQKRDQRCDMSSTFRWIFHCHDWNSSHVSQS